jgi:hypothetical protein
VRTRAPGLSSVRDGRYGVPVRSRELRARQQLEVVAALRNHRPGTRAGSDRGANRGALAAAGNRADQRTDARADTRPLGGLARAAVVVLGAAVFDAQRLALGRADVLQVAGEVIGTTVPQADRIELEPHAGAVGQAA